MSLYFTLFTATSQQCFSLTSAPANSYQPVSSTFLSQQISTSHHPQPAEQREFTVKANADTSESYPFML